MLSLSPKPNGLESSPPLSPSGLGLCRLPGLGRLAGLLASGPEGCATQLRRSVSLSCCCHDWLLCSLSLLSKRVRGAATGGMGEFFLLRVSDSGLGGRPDAPPPTVGLPPGLAPGLSRLGPGPGEPGKDGNGSVAAIGLTLSSESVASGLGRGSFKVEADCELRRGIRGEACDAV